MEIAKVYSEVYEILNILGNDYIEKIPVNLYEHICNERNLKSMVEFDIDKPIEEQDLSLEALEFISYLNLQYWCSEEEKQELLNIYTENDEKIEKELREKYNPDNIFKKQQKIVENTEYKDENLIIYKKESFLKKIFNIIINKFKTK